MKAKDLSDSAILQRVLSKEGILTLTLNRPKQLNAMNDQLYLDLIEGLDFAMKEDAVFVVVLTGSGFRSFSAGADLSAGFDPFVGPLKSGKGSYQDPVGRFMTKVIKFGKPLIAAVQGIAVGVGTTILPHCDVVYAAPHATFETPFTKVGVCPEFCSSILFPRIMGPSSASEMLYFGKKMTSQEAQAAKLVGEIIQASSREEFLEKVYAKMRTTLSFPNAGKSMRLFKNLFRNADLRNELEMVHFTEMALLDKRSTGNDSDAAVGVADRKSVV